MRIRDLSKYMPIHHDLLELYGDLEITPEDWQEIDGKIVLDMAKIKRERENKNGN